MKFTFQNGFIINRGKNEIFNHLSKTCAWHLFAKCIFPVLIFILRLCVCVCVCVCVCSMKQEYLPFVQEISGIRCIVLKVSQNLWGQAPRFGVSLHSLLICTSSLLPAHSSDLVHSHLTLNETEQRVFIKYFGMNK